MLVYQQQKIADHGKKLVAFLKWAVTDGQKISSTLDYAPLPDNVQSRELELIGTIRYDFAPPPGSFMGVSRTKSAVPPALRPFDFQ